MQDLFFFNDTATTEIYTLSLHDALPISDPQRAAPPRIPRASPPPKATRGSAAESRGPCVPACRDSSCHPSPCCSAVDRKSTRLNSSHANISYAVFCLKKKKKQTSLCSLT